MFSGPPGGVVGVIEVRPGGGFVTLFANRNDETIIFIQRAIIGSFASVTQSRSGSASDSNIKQNHVVIPF
jgi:hypothetical protein